jgi:hypothetical protein
LNTHIVLLGKDGAEEPHDGGSVRKMPTTRPVRQ